MNAKQALAAAVLMAASVAQAQTFGVHLGSVHVPAKSLNSFNPGAYVRMHNGFTAGGYLNSYRKFSAYAGWTWTLAESGPWSLDVTAALASGYPKGRVVAGLRPIVMPSVAYGDDWRVRVAYGPRVDPKRGVHLVHFSVERSF
jgi:hypothetical protein